MGEFHITHTLRARRASYRALPQQFRPPCSSHLPGTFDNSVISRFDLCAYQTIRQAIITYRDSSVYTDIDLNQTAAPIADRGKSVSGRIG